MTPSSLEALLHPLLGAVSIATVTDVNDGRGIFSDVVRITFRTTPHGLPDSVVVKTPVAGPNGEAARTSGAFAREAMAYRALLPAGGIATPRCFAHSDDGIFVLDDLSLGRSVDQLDGASPADAIAVAEALGTFHARWAGKADPAGAVFGANPLATIDPHRFGLGFGSITKTWASVLNPDVVATYASLAGLVDRAIAAFAGLGPSTITHGDPRLDNVAFVDDRPVFFDWQQVAKQTGVADLAWFLATSLTPTIRRTSNTAILQAYATSSGRRLTGVTDDLQIAAVYPGLMSMLLATRVPESARSKDLIATSLDRIGTMLADLETTSRLAAI